MQKLIVDPIFKAKLTAASDGAVLCDETGTAIGYFAPVADKSLYEGVDSPISEEELRQRKQEGGGRTLREILSDLEKNG